MKDVSEIRYSKGSTWLYFWLADAHRVAGYDNWKIETFPHRKAYEACLRKLKQMGYQVTKDPRIEEHYKSLSKYHRYASKDGLEIEIEICANNFKFEFFQNVVMGERKQGDGKFEFNKWELMPYLMKKQFELTCNALIKIMAKHFNSIIERVDTPMLSDESIVKHCTGNHWKTASPLQLSDIVNCVRADEGSYNTTDRNKLKITSGEVKYFRDRRTGRLMYGTVYHNINNMWWVRLDKFKYTNVACFELFDPSPEDFAKRRVVKDRMPESKKKELEFLNSLSASTLKKLLRKAS